MKTRPPDVVVLGAGVVGAACAWALAREGVRVLVLESGVVGGGATAAGMGHIVVMDDSGAEFALTHYSRNQWLQLGPELPPEGEFRRCGTIWVATDEEEFLAVRRKHEWYSQHGVCTEILDSAALREAEPNLRSGLAGGLLVPDDAVVYAPAIVPWLLRRAAESVELRLCAPITEVSPGSVRLADGERIDAGEVVCALGCGAARIFPGVGVRPRKGHLAITDRYPGFVRHQVVELGYMKSAHQASLESVAFNAQPRATGQVLLGSSRQFGDETSGVDWALLARMIRHAALFMPALDRLSVIRVWTGFRAATEDKLPLIGPYEAVDRVTLATGHEGLGITTALATAELVAAQIAGRAPAIPPEHPAPECARMAESIDIVVNGRLVRVAAGTSAAAALLVAGFTATRTSVTGEPRGPLCGMGICFECRASIDGHEHVRTCQVVCRPGNGDYHRCRLRNTVRS